MFYWNNIKYLNLTFKLIIHLQKHSTLKILQYYCFTTGLITVAGEVWRLTINKVWPLFSPFALLV